MSKMRFKLFLPEPVKITDVAKKVEIPLVDENPFDGPAYYLKTGARYVTMVLKAAPELKAHEGMSNVLHFEMWY